MDGGMLAERRDPARLVTQRILDRICYQCGGDLAAVVGPRRTKSVVEVRRRVIAHLRGMGLSYPEIGALLNRDHATIMNYLRPKNGRGVA